MNEARTVLLIHCSKQHATTIRKQAKVERRTISGYVLNVVMRQVDFEEILVARVARLRALNGTLSESVTFETGPRTTMLLACARRDAKRIRRAARLREVTISGFVLGALNRSWKLAGIPPVPVPITSAPRHRIG